MKERAHKLLLRESLIQKNPTNKPTTTHPQNKAKQSKKPHPNQPTKHKTKTHNANATIGTSKELAVLEF